MRWPVSVGGIGGTLLVAEVRRSFRGKDAGRGGVAESYRPDRGRSIRDERRGAATQPMFRQSLLKASCPGRPAAQAPWTGPATVLRVTAATQSRLRSVRIRARGSRRGNTPESVRRAAAKPHLT